mmetsp:Transcript_25053/g.44549  ORF Transcript_25053/g.44549 Transcript_25053/m.44549 type:complete len:367 (-) Transcript_25053:183-1283(-)|eukprot:CAMPEP_0197527976 /NCGR_PEP_ID=MMETSP1318-20131121/23417_1 /TAXON_ID=552666 /ORGANISM="Partenskyella glossopodia, Strain RCC365" /LENGTH=366 /DNA_ID=CAMNT_0043082871 /DNA_START=101 /DNA_END=1204 /DNA_ORIENTATION=+
MSFRVYDDPDSPKFSGRNKITDWMANDNELANIPDRPLSRIEEEEDAEKTWYTKLEDFWTKTFCWCRRRNEKKTEKFNDDLKATELTLYDVEYLKMKTSFTDDEILVLAKQYGKVDLNGDGVVTSDELVELPEFRKNPIKQRLQAYFEAQNGGKTVFSIRKFIKTLSVFSPRSSIKEKCRFLFNVYDCDGDGKIGREDLKWILSRILVDSLLSSKAIDDVVEKTFQECAKHNRQSLLKKKDERYEYIDFKTFEKILVNTDVGSKVSIDLLKVSRENELDEFGRKEKRKRKAAKNEAKNRRNDDDDADDDNNNNNFKDGESHAKDDDDDNAYYGGESEKGAGIAMDRALQFIESGRTRRSTHTAYRH